MHDPQVVGVAAAVASVGMPAAGIFMLSGWRPVARAQRAAKVAAWPAILLLCALGGPLARALLGVESGHLMDLTTALKGYVVLAPVLGCIAFVGAYAMTREPSSAQQPPHGP